MLDKDAFAIEVWAVLGTILAPVGVQSPLYYVKDEPGSSITFTEARKGALRRFASMLCGTVPDISVTVFARTE